MCIMGCKMLYVVIVMTKCLIVTDIKFVQLPQTEAIVDFKLLI